MMTWATPIPIPMLQTKMGSVLRKFGGALENISTVKPLAWWMKITKLS